jgi:hypothetical protein
MGKKLDRTKTAKRCAQEYGSETNHCSPNEKRHRVNKVGPEKPSDAEDQAKNNW